MRCLHYKEYVVVIAASSTLGKIFWCKKCGAISYGSDEWKIPDYNPDPIEVTKFDEQFYKNRSKEGLIRDIKILIHQIDKMYDNPKK